MARVEKSIEVHVPLETAYNQWTQFEEFPRFMEGIQEVRQLDDSRLFWAAEVGGERKEWYARITRQVRTVTFHPKADDSMTTEIQVQMEYEPEDTKEQVGDALGMVSRRVEGDLKRFKEFIESRGSETGAWRGTVGGEERGTTGLYGASGQGGTNYGGTREPSPGFGATEEERRRGGMEFGGPTGEDVGRGGAGESGSDYGPREGDISPRGPNKPM
jgi:hypothetical protein